MSNLVRSFVKDESGATAIEYGLIAAGISVAIIAVVQSLGSKLNATFTSGVATVVSASNGLLTLYKAETAVVAVTDGTISAAGADQLTVVVSAAALNKLAPLSRAL